MYFNYHAKAKKLILEGRLINYKIVENYNNISPALLLIFDNCTMPIRQHKWQEYLTLIENMEKESNN